VPAGKRDIVVAIDAGHGGEDPGASGLRGQHEKDIVLQIAKELQRQINSESGFRAELTRTGDYFIPLRAYGNRPQEGRRPVHFDPRRRRAVARSLRRLGVRPVRPRRHFRDGALAGRHGKPFRPDRRCGQRQPRRQGPHARGVLLDLSMTATLSSSLNVGQKCWATWACHPLHKQRVEQAGSWC
jgi:N-acetylmuramoyl-L-alanine amidase